MKKKQPKSKRTRRSVIRAPQREELSNWISLDDIRDRFNEEAKAQAEERARHPERDYSVAPYRDNSKHNSYDDGDPNGNFRP